LLTLTSPGKRVPAAHPIREIKRLADEALRKLDSVFEEMYSSIGRPSIPPERLLKAQLLIALYSVGDVPGTVEIRGVAAAGHDGYETCS